MFACLLTVRSAMDGTIGLLEKCSRTNYNRFIFLPIRWSCVQFANTEYYHRSNDRL